MDSDKKIEIHCGRVELRPELGLQTLVEISLEYSDREIFDMGDGDLHTVNEFTDEAIHLEMYLGPDTDVRATLRVRFEIEDDVSEAISSRISSVLKEYCDGGIMIELAVKVVEDSVFSPDDISDDDYDDGEYGFSRTILREDHDTAACDVDMENYEEEEEEYIQTDATAAEDEDQHACYDLVPSSLSEGHDGLMSPATPVFDLHELEEGPGLGMWDLVMGDYECEEGEEEEEEEEEVVYGPRGTGAPEEMIARLKKEGEKQAQSLKRNLDSANCVVCMEEWSDSDMVIDMPCSHVFHSGCIFEWL
ncbi:PREDICTED: E3 ubiquitin ligase BIG BROTHER-related-like [Tarenaya hassleriana]|uniref:E3 ubiquitin ligase BIG BROTHER-related-like n=1 Tax=Tarenaya hassleriana TaxID=28532 RepID=UPI00053CA101|nr:PREDICTED: E3 ubiquitin ligase BIG BROTHER-related-like [Tarenaya hassleriana]